MFSLPVQLTTSRIGNLTRLTFTLALRDDRTYIRVLRGGGGKEDYHTSLEHNNNPEIVCSGEGGVLGTTRINSAEYTSIPGSLSLEQGTSNLFCSARSKVQSSLLYVLVTSTPTASCLSSGCVSNVIQRLIRQRTELQVLVRLFNPHHDHPRC